MEVSSMTDRDGRKRLDSTLATAEAASFDAFEIDCPKCGSQIHVPYGRMPCPACGESVSYDPLTNNPV